MVFVFTGPESSGKTTLTTSSAAIFGGGFVSEYAREYLEVKNGIYSYKDLEIIGIQQFSQEQLEVGEKEYIWCDTDILTILIWSLDKFKRVNSRILNIWNTQNFNQRHYFLCFPDIPWENDLLRENPDDRLRIFDLYKGFLEEKELKYTVLQGTNEEKQEAILEIFYQYFPVFEK